MVDRQNRAGVKFGSGGIAGSSESNVDRRERLRKLALETIDLAKDPYFMRNHLGSYECKLCLTLHSNEGSYLAHTQGKKHQSNLHRRAARDARDSANPMTVNAQAAFQAGGPIVPRKVAIKIGRPGYKITKIRDPQTRQLGMLFQIQYPQIDSKIKPRHRFMSAFEQRVEPAQRQFQYLLIAAEPYETVAFKIQSKEIDRAEGRFWTHWDPDARQFSLQFFFKGERAPGHYSGDSGIGVRGPPPSASVKGGFVPTGANARPIG
ncbi:Splicing factor 3A subunit 2 [Podochytrium sp. JEL0797]|nr:Splicing factor 3A subunit 2 [Podochytrium sp. JEL0797]KAJ3074767.1 Splicing factor 3A subunit 2 [Podochytrium sp. JEL0797]